MSPKSSGDMPKHGQGKYIRVLPYLYLIFKHVKCTKIINVLLCLFTAIFQLRFTLLPRYRARSAFMFNTLRLRQNGHHFPDDIFKYIFLNENVWISIKISLKVVPNGPINNNIPALVQIMDWRPPCDKPLSEPMMVSLLTYICVTRPQWVKDIYL